MPVNEDDAIAARADLCRLLAACYYELDEGFAQEGVFGTLQEVAAAVDGALEAPARRLAAAHAADDLQTLLVDYTRLFLGPERALAYPYGSMYLDEAQRVMGESTVALLDLYRAGGFEVAEDFRELPDHIAAELEFLYQLLFRAAHARLTEDAAALAEAAALRQRLLAEHLGRWAAPFAAALRSGAQCEFYRALADLTETFVAFESRAAARA